jgi:DNA-binding transcriptional LysR family regulator
VVVTAFPSAAVAFAPALARSLRAHPRLALLLRQSSPPDGLQLVRSGEVEVAIVDDWTGRMAATLGTGEEGGLPAMDSGNGVLSHYLLLRDPLVLVVERGHPAADPDLPVDLRALRNEPWLAAPAGEPSRQAVDRLLAAVGVAPPAASEFEGLGTVANLVARGLGIAIMPRLAVGAYERRLVVRELPAGLDLSRDIYAVARTASVMRPSVSVIISALRSAARSISARATTPEAVPEQYAGEAGLAIQPGVQGLLAGADGRKVHVLARSVGDLGDARAVVDRRNAHLGEAGHVGPAELGAGRPAGGGGEGGGHRGVQARPRAGGQVQDLDLKAGEYRLDVRGRLTG